MAPTPQNVMDGLVTRLLTISGLRVSGFVPDQINPPQAICDFGGDWDYHGTFKNGLLKGNPTVTILISQTSDRTNQKALSDYASATGALSIVTAIEADSTLGGTVHDCGVVGFRRLSSETYNGISYYGGVFTLEVLAAGV